MTDNTTDTTSKEDENRLSVRPKLGNKVLSEVEREKLPPIAPSERKCTDLLFLLIFIVYWIGMLAIGYLGFKNGDPNRLVYGSDHNGVVCGGDERPNEPYVVYPRTTKDVVLAGDIAFSKPWEVKFFGICASKCPVEGDFVCTDQANAIIGKVLGNDTDMYEEERKNLIRNCDSKLPFSSWWEDLIDVPDIPFAEVDEDCKQIRSGCHEMLFNTTGILFRCFPKYFYEVETLDESGCTKYRNVTKIDGSIQETCVRFKSVKKVTREEPTSTNLLFDSFNTAANIFNRYMADLIQVYPVILACGVGMSAAVGLIYASSLWCCVGLMVWLSVFMCIALASLFTIYCYFKAGIIQSKEIDFLTEAINQIAISGKDLVGGDGSYDNVTVSSGDILPEYFTLSEDYRAQFEIAAYLLTACTVLLIILTLVLGRRISKAIEIFKEASYAVKANPALIVVPPLSMCFLVAVISYWAFATAYIASSGSYELEDLNTTFSVNPDEEVFQVKVFGSASYGNLFMAYLFLGLLWTAQFLNGIGVMTIAGTIGSWFWGGAREDRVYGYWPVARSFYTTIRFHLGTIAFGSLLVAIVQLLRYIAVYIQSKSQKLQKKNKIIKIIFCCVHCFLKCVETCVKFVSRNSYIMCAMYGETFCTSTKKAFFAIASNLSQVATVTFLGDVIMRFGQVMITIAAGMTCWLYLDNNDKYQLGGTHEVSSFLWPVALSMIFAWYVGAEVLSIYDITVDTILLSYCQDKKLVRYRKGYSEKTSLRFASFVKRHRKRKSNNARYSVLREEAEEDIQNMTL